MALWKTKPRKSGATVEVRETIGVKKDYLEDDGVLACRICFEETRDPLQLISPCRCKGASFCCDPQNLSRHMAEPAIKVQCLSISTPFGPAILDRSPDRFCSSGWEAAMRTRVVASPRTPNSPLLSLHIMLATSIW